MSVTTVWSDLRGDVVQHLRRIEAAWTLCGLGSEHTRNFEGGRSTSIVCETCREAAERLRAS